MKKLIFILNIVAVTLLLSYRPGLAKTVEDGDIPYKDPPPQVWVTKTANPLSLPEPGGQFTFTVDIFNNGKPIITITSLIDDIHGDLNGRGTCYVPFTLLPLQRYTCQFTATVLGNPGYTETDIVTASGTDNNGTPVSGEDDATVTITPLTPVINVVKTADPEMLPEPGGPVTFSVLVENNSSPADPVTITSLVDSIHGDLDGQGTCFVPQTILPGGSYACEFSATVSGNANDSETDVVTASGTDDDGEPVSDDDDATVKITNANPIINVIKTATPTVVAEPSGAVTFSVVVENLSNPSDPVTITSLVDNIHGDLNGQGTCAVPQTIQPGGNYACEFTATVSGSAGDSETDIVTASGTDDEGTPVSDSDDATVEIISDGPPVINVIKTAAPVSVPEPGGTVTFTVEIENNSNPFDPVTITSLVDDIHGDLDGQGTCDVPQTILPGESYTCEFSATVNGNAGDSETDTVTATGHDDEGETVTDWDDETVTVTPVDPLINVIKTGSPTSIPEPGGAVTFTVVVENLSGPTDPVTITSLVDNIHGDLDGQGTCDVPQTILPGASYTCEFQATVNGNAGDSETDVVTASGTDDDGTPVSDWDDETITILPVDPVIDVIKTANPTSVPEPGGVVTFTVVIENLSNPQDPVTITSLVDSIHGDLDGQGTCDVPQTILPGASYTCEFQATVNGNAGDSETDVVTASGTDDDGTPVSDFDDATVEITPTDPVIDVIKTADPTSVPEPGGDVTFSVVIENLSNPYDPVTITSLVDSIHGDLDGQGTCDVPQTILPGESYECAFTATVSGNAGDSETDVVTASGTDDDGTPVSDFDDATVEITPTDPVIDVTKTADPTEVVEPGGDVTFTVVIENLSNPYDPVTITSLVDSIYGDLDGQGTCDIPQTILPGASYTCEFTATVSGAPGDTETDVVTASGTDDEGTPVSDFDDATVTIIPTPPVINVIKTATPTEVTEPGGVVNFNVVIENNSGPQDPVTITSLVDSIHGNLDGQGTCDIPQTIQPGDSYECDFTATVSGVAGYIETDVVTASGTDDDGTPVSDSDDATVTIIPLTPLKYYLPLLNRWRCSDITWGMAFGYEDVRYGAGYVDFDYNDWVTYVNVVASREEFGTCGLDRIDFTITPQARGAQNDHSFHILIPANTFASDGVATLEIFDQNGAVVSSETLPFDASVDNDYLPIPLTSDALLGDFANTIEGAPFIPSRRTAELSIVFENSVVFPFDNYDITSPHGEGLFFDPYLFVIQHPGWDGHIHIGDPNLLAIPDINFDWAEETRRLDTVYTDVGFIPGTPPTLTFPDGWWEDHNNCVYDQVICIP